MADSFEKTVLIEVKLKTDQLATKIVDLNSSLDQLLVKQLQLTAGGKQNTQEFVGLSSQIRITKQEIRDTSKELDNISRAFNGQIKATSASKNIIAAASGSYKEAQQQLTALGNSIRNAEKGFTQMTPAVKKQIAEYKLLNDKLKAFDAQMGNHQRSVGHYVTALSGFSTAINGIIPGFSQFSSILTGAARGFNAMGSSAKQAGEDAETSMGSLASSAGPILIGIAAIIAALASEITYLLQFQKLSDGISKTWAGIKGSVEGFMTYMNNNNEKLDDNFTQFKQHWADFFHSIGIGYEQASKAQGLILDLARQSKNAATLTASEDERVQLLIKEIRDRTTSAAKAQEDYNEVLEINTGQYKRNYNLATQTFQAQTKAAIAGLNLNKDQLNSITDLSLGYEKLTENAKKLLDQQKIGKDFLDKYNEGLQAIIAVDNKKVQSDEMAKIRDDMKQAREDTAREKELAELAKIKQETEQIESDRIASFKKTLDFKREEFAKELSDADEHYRQLIFKQRKFIEDMQVIVDSKKSTAKEKTAAKGGISAANGLIGQITNEQSANQQKLLEDHSKAILAETQKAANDLSALQIQGINDTQERERQSENLSYREKQEASKKEIDKLKEDQTKLTDEIKTAKGERLAVLKQELSDTQNFINIANDKQIENQIQHDRKLLNLKKQAALDLKTLDDQIDILNQKIAHPGQETAFNKKLESAEISEINDQTQASLQSKGLDGDKNPDGSAFSKIQMDQKVQIEKEGQLKINELVRQNAQKRKEIELNAANQVANAAFSIIEQSLQQSNQAKEISLEKQKGYDLQNQSLTSTQKYEIEEKYRVLAGKQKVKEFEQEKAINIAKTIMATAQAVMVAMTGGPFSGEILAIAAAVAGAAEIAVIASQKPPAYAQGGLHYNSDGRGGVLPGYSKTDNTNAYLRSGEAVVVSEAMRDPWARNMVSAINQSYGGRSFDSTVPVNPWFSPGFASGGVFNNYLPTGDNGLRPQIQSSSNGRLHPEDIAGIAQAVSSIKFPPIYTDIKDINNQQGILTNVNDRRTY